MSDPRTVTLAQKYRPLVFKDVLGQDAIITVLSNILKDRNFASPFMFTGHYGGGKTTLARIFARAILCESLTSNFEPCNKCSSCISFLGDSNLAYTEIDAASNSGVDQIRKLRDEANFKVLGNSHHKVVVIDESHSISTQGNEALLKQLEDSSERQIYIFCTTSPEKMLETVRSRCFEFSLNKIHKNLITPRLEEICKTEKITYEIEALDTIADQCSPHVRDALKVLDYLSNFGRVTKNVVYDHFKLDSKIEYLKVVLNLKDNLLESLKLAKNLSLENDISKIYEGIIEAIINCQKLTLGLSLFKSEEQLSIAKEIIDKYKINLPRLLEELLKRNRYVDILLLESDLILLHSKLKTNFVNITSSEIQVVEYIQVQNAPIEFKQEYKIDVSPEPIPETIVEPIVEPISAHVIDEEPLEQTTKVLKRYPAYPHELALLMDKGKKSSSIKNSSTVELKQRVKDYKRGLDKDEIKNFLELKRTIT